MSTEVAGESAPPMQTAGEQIGASVEADAKNDSPGQQTAPTATKPEGGEQDDTPPMSKSALKRLRKRQEWEEGAEDRRKRRKEKQRERKDRQREQRDALLAQGVDRSVLYPKREPSTTVPVAVVLDCDFESYMTDKERVSLSSQVTRSYSDNRAAKYRAHLWVAGWRGRLLERFNGPLDGQYRNWRGVGFFEGDFAECSLRAAEKMRAHPGEMIGSLQRSLDAGPGWTRDDSDPLPLPDPEPEPSQAHRDIVYLTSDSPYTLERLEPNKCYIVGGLVDRNREKGLCYRRARERGIRTARLPIGQFMVMQSRQVLATNHVVEIMLKWLEYEDWAAAFEAVIPKRKGGVLRKRTESESRDEAAGEADAAVEEAEAEAEEEQKEEGEGSATTAPPAGDSEHDKPQDERGEEMS